MSQENKQPETEGEQPAPTPTVPATMKAIRVSGYGEAEEVMSVDEKFPVPAPSDKEILINVKASSLNPVDWKLRSGKIPSLVRPKVAPSIPGTDYAGVVVQVGQDVKSFKVGDKVFGKTNVFKKPLGTCAQYLTINPSKDFPAIIPESLSFEQAAALPLASITSWWSLDKPFAALPEGSKVLIAGCTGGVGHVAVQHAKALGWHVTGICSTSNVEFAKELGCDEVVDYRSETKGERVEDIKKASFDAVIDMSGKFPRGLAEPLLKSGGGYATVTPGGGEFFRGAFNWLLSPVHAVLANQSEEATKRMVELIEQGKLTVRVRTSPLDEVIQETIKAEKAGGIGRGKLVFVHD